MPANMEEGLNTQWVESVLRPGKRPVTGVVMDHIPLGIALSCTFLIYARNAMAAGVPLFAGIHRYVIGAGVPTAAFIFGTHAKFDIAERREENLRSFVKHNKDAFLQRNVAFEVL